jgi:hypothetical protein
MQIKLCDWVHKQTNEAAITGEVHIRDGQKIPVWMLFRCLYCGEYFAQAGAEEHFGKTRLEYNEDAKAEQVIEIMMGVDKE